MAYYRFNGVKYGVCSHRPIWKSILVSLPIINLLYTKKIRVSLTSRNKYGSPLTGIHGDFRIFRWQKTVKFRFMVPETFHRVLFRVTNMNETETYCSDGPGGPYSVGLEFYDSLTLQKKGES